MAQTASFSIEIDGTNDGSAYRQIRRDLALATKRWRRRGGVSQGELARRLGLDTPPTGGNMSEHESSSLDLLVRSLLALGATRRDIALEIVRTMPPGGG